MTCFHASLVLSALSLALLGGCGNDSTEPAGSGGSSNGAGAAGGTSASTGGGASTSASGSATAASTGAGGGATGTAAATGSGGMGMGGFGPCAPQPGCDTTDFPADGTCQDVGLVDCSHAAINCCIPAAQQMNEACNCFSKCAAPDTPIATPSGDRPIAALRAGDLVYSVSGQAVRAVPLLRVQRVEVVDHEMVRVALASGRVIEMSPGHPTADGRTFGALAAGDALDGATIAHVERVRIARGATHDVLPDSDTGAYFAAGTLVGSTMAR